MESIKNVYCVGRNYASFASEMGNKLSTTPIIFMKPTHSLEKMNGGTIELSGDQGEVNCEIEVVLHIGRMYEKGMQVKDLVDKVTMGIDFTYREVLNDVKQKGQPWLPAKGFPGGSGIGEFHPISLDILEQDFTLYLNGETQQVGNIKNMIFSLQTLIDFIGENYGLGTGDLIYTGTPEGIGKLKSGDELQLQWGEDIVGTSKIELK